MAMGPPASHIVELQAERRRRDATAAITNGAICHAVWATSQTFVTW
jgi:hypothetical protein